MSRFSGKPTFDVYVTNLPDDIDEEFMKQEFSICGAVHSCTLKDGRNNAAKFGFVRYVKEESQEMAANQLCGKFLKGKIIMVRKADYKKKNNTEGTLQNGEKRQNRGDQQSSSTRTLDQQKSTQDYVEQAILVTYVVNACTVYAQLAKIDMAEVSAKLMTEINQYCPVAQRLIGPPSLNTVYGALFSEDGMWYRCKVIMPNSDMLAQHNAKVAVHYLDYGNDEIVDVNTLVELPMSLASLQAQAHQLVFRGIVPTAENVEDNRKTTSSCTCVEIFDGNTSLNDVLIQQGFVIKVAPSLQKQLMNLDTSPTSAIINSSSSPSSKGSIAQGTPSPKNAPNAGRGLLDTPPMLNNNMRSPNLPRTTSPSILRAGPGGVSAERHHIEIQSLMNEITHLRVDKAELINQYKQVMDEVGRIAEEKREIQVEYQSVKEAAANTLVRLKQIEGKMKTSMQDKVTSLLETMVALKQTRKQVVIDPDVRDPVKNAMALLTNSANEFVSLGDGISHQDVDAACTHFNLCQKKFDQPEAKDHVDELISARDNARQTTYQMISDFLDSVNHLPLTMTKSQIKESLDELKETYDIVSCRNPDTSLTGCGDGDREHINVCINYKQWKEKKSKQLKALRENTDALAAEWRQIVQTNMVYQFDLTSHTTIEPTPAIDELAHCFMVAMETEIAMTGHKDEDVKVDPELLEKKKEETSQEAAILENTVCVLLMHLQKELDVIDELMSLKTSYALSKMQHEKWLNANPDVSNLLGIQKVAKSLRRKLRHKLADKHDLEEDPELNGGGDLEKIEEELADIRLALQKAYIQEDQLMKELSELSRRQFGEIPLQYPSFGIENHLTTLGLVKLGRDIQHFDLKPLPGCDKKMIRLGQFNNKPVVIKSFFIPDDEVREEFLIQASLTMASCPAGLLRLDAVYSLPTQGEIHVQVPYIEMGSLEAAVAKQGCFSSEPLTDNELQGIFYNVLLGVFNTHDISCIHGAVHPRNILLVSRTSAVLAEYDNSKTPTQRVQQGYKTSNGLSFTAPEIINGASASMESDMYSFGILLLWAHYPDIVFPTLPDGTPDLTVIQIKPSIKDIVTSLLSYAQVTRPSSQKLRFRNYFDYTSDEDSEFGCLGDEVNDGAKEMELEDETKDEVVMEDVQVQHEDADIKDKMIQDDEKQTEKTQQNLDEITGKEKYESKEDGEEEKQEAEGAEKIEEKKQVEDKPNQQGNTEVSSPASSSILLQKMVIAMASSEETAAKEVTKTPEGSEI